MTQQQGRRPLSLRAKLARSCGFGESPQQAEKAKFSVLGKLGFFAGVITPALLAESESIQRRSFLLRQYHSKHTANPRITIHLDCPIVQFNNPFYHRKSQPVARLLV